LLHSGVFFLYLFQIKALYNTIDDSRRMLSIQKGFFGNIDEKALSLIVGTKVIGKLTLSALIRRCIYCCCLTGFFHVSPPNVLGTVIANWGEKCYFIVSVRRLQDSLNYKHIAC
jgi:hypothetical protein